MTRQLLLEYNQLIEILKEKKNDFPEDKISIFNFAKGKFYNNELLIIGRAVNGWNEIDKFEIHDALDEVKFNVVNDNLQWVIDKWGKPNENYNTNRSAFWRICKSVATDLIGNKQDNINYIAWTNLYKVSKHDRGNPSSRLMNIQFEQCKRIIELEIELLDPKVILFLTSWDWAKWFFADDDLEKIEIKKSFQYVEFVGKFKNSIVIVGQHPQSKPEGPHCEEILLAIKIAKAKLKTLKPFQC